MSAILPLPLLEGWFFVVVEQAAEEERQLQLQTERQRRLA